MKVSGNFISALPLELLFDIIELLPVVSRIRLGLTEKALFKVICPDGVFPKLYTQDLIGLLLDLESTSRHSYICFSCQKLHRHDPACGHDWHGDNWHRSDFRRSRFLFQTERVPCYYEGFKSIATFRRSLDWSPGGPWDEHRIYPFEEAHLVMNRHFYGVGLPLETLNHSFEFERWINVFELHKLDKHFPLSKHEHRERPFTRAFHEAMMRTMEYIRDESYRPKTPWQPIRRPRTRGFPEEIIYSTQDIEDSIQPAKIPKQSIVQSETANRSKNETPVVCLQGILPWTFQHRAEARIIHDELYMSFSHTITGPLIQRKIFVKLIEMLNIPICSHIYCQGTPAYWNVYGMDLDEYEHAYLAGHALGYRITSRTSFEACKKCFTDYRISMQRNMKQEQWELNIATYHCLGACRTPMDFKWNDLHAIRGFEMIETVNIPQEREDNPVDHWPSWRDGTWRDDIRETRSTSQPGAILEQWHCGDGHER